MSGALPVAGRAAVRRAAVGDLAADRGAVVGIVVLNGLAAAAALVGPWLLGRIIDTIHGGGAVLGTVDRLAAAAVIFTLVQILLARWALVLGYRFGERAAARVRERFLDRTLALPSRVVDGASAGDLIARGSTDAATVATTLRSALPEVLVALVHALFLVIGVLVLDPLLGLFGLAGLLGVGAAVRWYQRRARPAYLETAAAGAELADVVASTAAGARTVELLGLERRRSETAAAAVERARSARLRTLRLRSVLFPWADIAVELPVVGVVLVGGLLHLHGAVSIGVVVTSALYLRQLGGPLDTLMIWLEQLQGAGASYARVEGVAAAPTEGAPATPAIGRRGLSEESRFTLRDVHFAYPDGADVLHGIDLMVRPGERLAVVGTSGAGKTTLARLLAGLDRPRRGEVTVGGTSVADLPPEALRDEVVLITQEHHVFHDSVRDNLVLARPGAADDELRAALRVVGADWVDDLPQGLDTQLGTEVTLDGAAAQQLSLARVVLADPNTVILDEATALLDPRAARRTEQSLAAVLRGRTVIAIAHRLQTAQDADRIAVLEAGRLVELGSHDELVAADDHYGRLWRSWHSGDEDTVSHPPR